MFQKILDLELWIDFGWSRVGVLDPQDNLRMSQMDLNETNDTHWNGGGLVFWKILNLELWMDSG